MKRILNIVNILNFIKNLNNDEDKMSECISSLIGLTSITSVERSSTSEVVSRREKNVISYESIDDISKYLETNNFKKNVIEITKLLLSDINKSLCNNVSSLFNVGERNPYLSIITRNPKGRKRIVAKNWYHKKLMWIDNGNSMSRFYSVEDYEKNRAEFIKNIIASYNNITREEYQIKIPETETNDQ